MKSSFDVDIKALVVWMMTTLRCKVSIRCGDWRSGCQSLYMKDYIIYQLAFVGVNGDLSQAISLMMRFFLKISQASSDIREDEVLDELLDQYCI